MNPHIMLTFNPFLCVPIRGPVICSSVEVLVAKAADLSVALPTLAWGAL